MVDSSWMTEHNLILVCLYSKQSPPTECDNFKCNMQESPHSWAEHKFRRRQWRSGVGLVSLLIFANDYFLIIWRACDFFLRRNWCERSKSWLTFAIWVTNRLIMFGYQLVKRFPSPGYEVWEEWREHWLEAVIEWRRNDEVVAYKIVWVGLECSKWFTKRLLAVDSSEASIDTDRDAVSVWHMIVWQPTFLWAKLQFVC